MPKIRTDGLVFRRNENYLFTYPKGGGMFQFFRGMSMKLSNFDTKIDSQFLLMPKTIFTSWEKE